MGGAVPTGDLMSPSGTGRRGTEHVAIHVATPSVQPVASQGARRREGALHGGGHLQREAGRDVAVVRVRDL